MKFASYLTVLLAALLGPPALAKPQREMETGSLITVPKRAIAPDRTLTKDELSRDLMNQFARCLVDRKQALVAKAIALPAGADEIAFQRAVTNECLDNGRMHFPIAVLRGAVFGELYRRQQIGSATVTRNFPIQPLDWSKSPQLTDSTVARTNYFLLWMADCVHKSKAQEIRSIVVYPVGSAAQKTAYAAVIPALGPCIPQGTQISFSRSMLEAAFGEYLYRSLVPAIPLASTQVP